MVRKLWFVSLVLIGLVILSACAANPITPTPAASLPNPASVHCEQNGGKLDLRQDASGGVAGICVFPDGSECDEWAFFRGTCKTGDVQSKPSSSPAATAPARPTAAQAAADGWNVYRNEELGYRFDYPANASIENNDEPLKSFSIVGPLSGNDRWPQISISHPSDREEFRTPEGVDLEKWLTDHYLLMSSGKPATSEARQPDLQIAGVEAIHTRLPRSPQTFAYDKYFFAKSQQLYEIVILHTGDKEDWRLYNRFLQSFRFDG